MDYEELKVNFCNLLCQISISDLEQFMKWIEKHVQGYNKFGLNYIKNFTSESNGSIQQQTIKTTPATTSTNSNRINCECGRAYVVNISINPTTTYATESGLNHHHQQQQQQEINNRINKRVLSSSTKLCNNKKQKTLKEQQQQQFTAKQQPISTSTSTSSSLSIDKDENNNDIIVLQQQQQQQNGGIDDTTDDLNSDIDDEEYIDDLVGVDQQQQHLLQQQLTLSNSTGGGGMKQQQQQQSYGSSSELNKIKCPVCSKPYSSNHTMLRHKMSIHDKLIKYCCKICDRSFFRKDKLATHISNHQDYDTYSCFLCKCKLKSKHILKNHLKKDHNLNGEEPNYNDLVLKCQLKETIDVDSNMVINYGDSVLSHLSQAPATSSSSSSSNTTTTTPGQDATTTTTATTTVDNLFPQLATGLVDIKEDNMSNHSSVGGGGDDAGGNNSANNCSDDLISLIRNRKSLVYDILSTPFDGSSSNNANNDDATI